MPKLMKELILMNEGIPAFPVHQPYYPQHTENVQIESINAQIELIAYAWEKYKKNNNPEELKKMEDIIAKSAKYSYYYARYVIKGPFPKGEDAIAKNMHYSVVYAQGVLKGPFPKGEDAIATCAGYSYMYARNILKGPFPKGETAIMKSEYADKYRKLINEPL